MTEKLKKRWIVVGAIWVGTLIFTFVNNVTIGRIISEREKDEILQKDQVFWNRNADNIKKILKKWKSAFHHVDSLKLGLLAVENHIIDLAGKHGIADVKMESQPEQGAEFGVPAEVSLKGTVAGNMAWLRDFENDCHFLPIRKLILKIDQTKPEAELKAYFDYRYKIAGVDNE